MARTERVTIPYAPRSVFLPYHNRTERFSCIVAHRRAGKTVAVINDLVKTALSCPLENPRVAYIAPYYAQAKAVAWDYAKHYSACIPGAKPNESELRIDYPNGGRLRLFGADNYDALRGIYLDDVALDEPADFPVNAWPMVIRPTLSDRRGRGTFIGTPKGKNEFFDVYDRARKSDDWYDMMLKASESGIIAQDELDSARRDMGEDAYEQEYECSFEAAIQGAYYAKEMADATKDKRICRVPFDPSCRVSTAWDIGIDDATAIWFVQRVGREVHVIDYLEASDQPQHYFVTEMEKRGYLYDSHILPHDAGGREKQTGKTYAQGLLDLGLRNVRVLPRADVLSGINAVRNFLPRCVFDEAKCERGIETLRQYRREFDEKRKSWRGTPRHDWTSHGADAMRYLATGMTYHADPHRRTQKPRPMSHLAA